MENSILNLTYSSSLSDLCSINSSFDCGKLRIAYTGINRNNSYISKDTFEKCLPSIYNCPIVCNYNRENDTLGGHDVEVIRDKEDTLKIVNITSPIGVVPESSNVWWEDITEEDGTIREYLCSDVLLWKRQEAYNKVKNDGIVSQSMEISVKSGHQSDNVYIIDEFEFNAFCLIGVEPCFENASLETYSKHDFMLQFTQMMQELKNFLRDIDSAHYRAKNITLKGGSNMEGEQNVYALVENIRSELIRQLEQFTVEKEWGKCNKYWLVDFDHDVNEVYCWDCEDHLLYGFPYSTNEDSVAVDFACKKRKKYSIVDFVDGSSDLVYQKMFDMMDSSMTKMHETQTKLEQELQSSKDMSVELECLRSYKKNAEEATEHNKRVGILEKFEDELSGVDEFATLKNECDKYDLQALEEKCYAIKGRNTSSLKFGFEPKNPKIKVTNGDNDIDEPYGGIVMKYKNR